MTRAGTLILPNSWVKSKLLQAERSPYKTSTFAWEILFCNGAENLERFSLASENLHIKSIISEGISGGFVFKYSKIKGLTGIFIPPPTKTIPAISCG